MLKPGVNPTNSLSTGNALHSPAGRIILARLGQENPTYSGQKPFKADKTQDSGKTKSSFIVFFWPLKPPAGMDPGIKNTEIVFGGGAFPAVRNH